MTESIVKNTGENIGDIINGNNFIYAKNEYNWKYIVRRITNLQYIKYEALLNNNKIGIGHYLNDNIICKIYENIHKIECIRIEYYSNNILIYIEHKNDYINLVYSMVIDINSRYILNHKLYNKEGIITSVYYTDNKVRRIEFSVLLLRKTLPPAGFNYDVIVVFAVPHNCQQKLSET